MLIRYTCDCCGSLIDTLEIDVVDEAKFGFDSLTGEERRSLIKVDAATGVMEVQSLCDKCIELMGLAQDVPQPVRSSILH